MSEEKMSCFYELINGFEIVGTLTDDGRKLVKDGVLHLQQENKQLKEKINTYENPEDLTLMYMWCNEKAKDEIRRLKEEINKISKKELKVMAMLRSIELCTLTKERIDQIEEVMFELEGNNE